ncbi:hypothetical protein BFO_2703 [Tannerella forsythia 92A2]|uniref:Uncharacterized protein n=1 Tax=Tannerella forsythia (strain ATCC 43037 / JCM 10827 / CCUG 21028 A / KCTC 5666 / FDC 338) TaxID=203275 RepID=G8UMA7_TANFA|nr:hypothetical protein BFO_2703 [Tannerella forsythia 92A2]
MSKKIPFDPLYKFFGSSGENGVIKFIQNRKEAAVSSYN